MTQGLKKKMYLNRCSRSFQRSVASCIQPIPWRGVAMTGPRKWLISGVDRTCLPYLARLRTSDCLDWHSTDELSQLAITKGYPPPDGQSCKCWKCNELYMSRIIHQCAKKNKTRASNIFGAMMLTDLCHVYDKNGSRSKETFRRLKSSRFLFLSVLDWWC